MNNEVIRFNPEDIIELDTTEEDDAKTITLSSEKDKAEEHLRYIASGHKERDDDERIRDVFTRKSVAEQKRNEQNRGK